MLTKLDLDMMAAKGCQEPSCKGGHEEIIFIHGRCHLDAPLEVSYKRGDGFLVVACLKCHKPITRVKVAE